MASYKRPDLHQRFMVVTRVLKGNPYRDVAISMGINFKTVGAIMKKHKSNISLADLPRVGRAGKTTLRKDRLLVPMSLGYRRLMDGQRSKATSGTTWYSTGNKNCKGETAEGRS